MTAPPHLLWVRRDLRLSDHPALQAALAAGGPVIPVFILDPETEALGAAPLWRLGLAIAAFDRALRARGSRLILRRGGAEAVLARLVDEAGAAGVHWSRTYDPAGIARDTQVKAALKAMGRGAVSHPGHVLFEPWEVATGQGGMYRVFTPFWRAVADRDPGPLIAGPDRIPAPAGWPDSDDLPGWNLAARMQRGASIVSRFQRVGEDAALDRLTQFITGSIDAYASDRNRPDLDATSGLSENLAWGEIAPRRLWHAALRAESHGAKGAETFRKEVVWRDFAYHLLYHTPHIAMRNWREEWDSFPWRADNADAERWRRGLTGEPFVDAAMREMYVTGRMHNRTRMVVASYLTKNLLTDWRVGLDWFADCLTDWDPASNAMGWQWTAGSGPDAAPYFRVFNPATQAETYDPKGTYRHRFIAEGSADPHPDAMAYFDAVPKSWALDPKAPYPEPILSLAEGRARALASYGARNS
jgi:deoxyribodipyrimidine photo-lyase